MKVKELIKKLQKLDPEANVYYRYSDNDYNCYYKIKYLSFENRQKTFNTTEPTVTLEA